MNRRLIEPYVWLIRPVRQFLWWKRTVFRQHNTQSRNILYIDSADTALLSIHVQQCSAGIAYTGIAGEVERVIIYIDSADTALLSIHVQQCSAGIACTGIAGEVERAKLLTWAWVREWCIAWWHSGREDEDVDIEDTPSDMGYATPVSVETPLPSSLSRGTSLNVIRDPYVPPQTPPSRIHPHGPIVSHHVHYDSRSLPSANRLQARSLSTDSVYTILIRLPGSGDTAGDCDGTADNQPSITMIAEDTPHRTPALPRPTHNSTIDFNLSLHPSGNPHNRRPSHIPDIRIPLNPNAKIIPKQLAGGTKTLLSGTKHHPAKKKKKTQEKKADKKAAKTLSAILLTFIITWTPYNILVLLKPLTACTDCIPPGLWDFFYYLCYINSTINPVCYALCNASFRRTYLRILTCKWHNRNRTAMNRGFYN
ncbi:Muscarinic acetylcholine receptor M5 [Homalodisca vitripennis]|nr:Muscarinic acetylcholine receptor M5 [Homalodisca vitripennis]